MGLLEKLGMRHELATQMVDVTASLGSALGGITDPSTFPISSPWSVNDLQRLVFDDVFPGGFPINSRSAAMRIPAVARARNLLVSTICRLPLVAYRGDELLSDELQPTFLYRTNTATSPQQRLAWTVDDLIFYGWSCWYRSNGADGFPGTAQRVEQGAWSIDADNHVLINGNPVPDDQVTLIPGLHEGILSYGCDTIRDTRRLYDVVRDRLENPVPAVNLHQTEGEPLTQPEIEDLLNVWRTARNGRGGAGVGYTNKTIEAKEMGVGSGEQLLIEARNAASLEIARVVGVGASRIDATAPKASLNYETTSGRNEEFVDLDLALYMTPITARLSLDDVVPRGTRVAFDKTELVSLTPTPTGPNTQD